jgi:ATP-dependent Zn protease
MGNDEREQTLNQLLTGVVGWESGQLGCAVLC